MYVQNYLLAFWQRLLWLDCVRYMQCVESHCARAPSHWLFMDTGWSLFRAHVVPVPESAHLIWVSVGVLLITNVHLLRTWAKCGCAHAVSYWWALACTEMFYVFFICCLCQVLSTSGGQTRNRASPSQIHNAESLTLFKMWIKHRHNQAFYQTGKTFRPHASPLYFRLE